MPNDFFDRLGQYYSQVGKVLKGNADSAAVFPNSTDKGQSRERIYADFIRTHAPAKCHTFFGGFLFDRDGAESKQMDIIVTTDTTPRFHFHNSDLSGKSFSPVEGTLAAITVKSFLDKKQLFDALENLASIPPVESLEGRLDFLSTLENYEDWPLKVIYASDGLEMNTIHDHLNTFYKDNPLIPVSRKPNIIHVAGKFYMVKAWEGCITKNPSTGTVEKHEMGSYLESTNNVDIQGLGSVIHELINRATASNYIIFSYPWIMNKMLGTE